MSRNEVKKMIDEVDDNKDGRLDYREVKSHERRHTKRALRVAVT